MKPSKILKSWLILMICGVCRSFFILEENDYIDSGSDQFDRSSRLSFWYPKESPGFQSDYSNDVEYMMDQPPNQSINPQPHHAIHGHKNSSSRAKPGRKKGRKPDQSSINQSNTRRKQNRKPGRVQQKGRSKTKSTDVDAVPGFEHLPQKSCPLRFEWVDLRTALNVNNTLVEVYQPDTHVLQGLERWTQVFYLESCENDAGFRDCPGCCKGIDHSKYSSSCTQRVSYVQALVKLPKEKRFYWSHIQVNSSCVCEFVSQSIPGSP